MRSPSQRRDLLVPLLWFAAVTMPLIGPTEASAQLSDGQRDSLRATLQGAKGSLDSQRLPNYDAAKNAVVSAADGVVQYFQPITSPDNLARWKAYLLLDPLVQAIQDEAAEDVVLERAQQTHSRLIGNKSGLELWSLVQLRARLEELIAVSRFRDAEKAIAFVDQQLTSLDERIGNLSAIPSADEAAALAAITKVISESKQTPAVPAALRSAFSRPNVVFTVSSALVQQAASQVVCRDRAINDCILGTRVIGNGTLQGTVTAQTLPSYGQATVQLTLSGRFRSRSVGYNGPVSLNTLGNGDVMSSRTVYLSEAGVSLAPTVTQASLSSQITSINHPLKIVRKIASRRAAEQKPQADAIARERLRNQVGGEFDRQVAQAVSGAGSPTRRANLDQAKTTLVRLDLPEPTRVIGSNEHSVFLEATQAAPYQLSAINSAPPLMIGAYDLAVQLHESVVDNVASRVLAGRTMTGEQLDQLLADAGRPPQSNPREVSSSDATNAEASEDASEEPFEIDFARLRPLIFEARDQTVKLGLRGTRFKQGERELARPIEITATYRPVQIVGGPTYLERVGDVGVDFPGGRRLTISQVALRRSIQRAFDDRFPEKLLDQSLMLPATLPVDSLRGKPLNATSIDSRDGWLSISAK